MIKVLFLIHDLGQGGAEKVLINLVNNIDQTVFDVTVISLFGGGVNEQFLKPDVRYHSVFSRSIKGNSILMKFLTPEQLHTLCVKDTYDIEVAYLEGPATRVISGCRNSRTKLVAFFHSMQFDQGQLASSFRSVKEAYACYAKFDRIVSVSKAMKHQVDKLLHMEYKSVILYNTIETDRIRKLAEENTDIIRDDSVVRLISVGTLKPVKGYDRLLRCVNKLKDEGISVELYLLGTGPSYDNLQKYVLNHNLQNTVHFFGYHTNPYKYMAACDVFICSSQSEGFSTAVTEALIVGLPIVTTDVSGMREMLGDNNEYGMIVRNDEESLYKGIKTMITDTSLRSNYRLAACNRGHFFDTQSTVKQMESFLNELFKKHECIDNYVDTYSSSNSPL